MIFYNFYLKDFILNRLILLLAIWKENKMAILTEGRIVPLLALLLAWVAIYISINMGREGKIKI